MAKIKELEEQQLEDEQLIELLENDPEADRLLGHVEAAVENLREIAGKNGNGDAAKDDASK